MKHKNAIFHEQKEWSQRRRHLAKRDLRSNEREVEREGEGEWIEKRHKFFWAFCAAAWNLMLMRTNVENQQVEWERVWLIPFTFIHFKRQLIWLIIN